MRLLTVSFRSKVDKDQAHECGLRKYLLRKNEESYHDKYNEELKPLKDSIIICNDKKDALESVLEIRETRKMQEKVERKEREKKEGVSGKRREGKKGKGRK